MRKAVKGAAGVLSFTTRKVTPKGPFEFAHSKYELRYRFDGTSEQSKWADEELEPCFL